MSLQKGKRYDLSTLEYCGWMKNGESIETPHGYAVDDYFTADGKYLGPDDEGIEPILMEPK